MHAISRIPMTLAFTLAGSTYLVIAVLVTGGSDPEAGPVEYWISFAMGLFLVLAATGWALIALRIGPLMPRIDQSHLPATPARRRRERHGTLLLAALILFVGGAPPAMMILQGEGLTAVGLAPPLVWAWNLQVFGFTRMRHAAITILSGQNLPADAEDRARDFLTGAALALAGGPDVEEIDATLTPENPALIPEPGFTIQNLSTGSHDPTAADALQRHALMLHLTGDGDPYRLLGMRSHHVRIYPTEMSAHERMQALRTYHAALDRLDDPQS